MTMNWLSASIIVIFMVVLMEIVAILVHKYVMHGPGWAWHRSHHVPTAGWFEMNDLYALLFGAVSLAFFTIGTDAWPPFWWAGVGMVVYGILYALLHDGIVHRRFPIFSARRSGYLKRLIQAHRLHHAVREREGAVSFGFLYAPPVDRLRQILRDRGSLG